MKPVIVFVVVLLLAASCNPKKQSTAETKNCSDTSLTQRQTGSDSIELQPENPDLTLPSLNPAEKEPKIKEGMFVDKETNYSDYFLKKLKKSGYARSYQLIENKLILDNKDTSFFPTFLPQNQNVHFAATKGDKHFYLKLRRLNYTTIEYYFECMSLKTKRLTDNEYGEVVIDPSFFFSSEADKDDLSGKSYETIEYTDAGSGKECWFVVRIGNDKGHLKVKIARACDDNSKSIYPEDCPTLRKK